MLSILQLKLRRLVGRLGFERDWYLILLAAVIGTLTAGGAIGFAWLIRSAEHNTEHAFETWSMWLLPFIPMAGALLCGILVHFFAAEAKGHGVPEVMDALISKGGKVRPRVAIVKSLASACTIGSGGSAGAEGPIAQIGAAIGSAIGQILRVSRDHQMTLLGCGIAAGISSIFNAPIAGLFFVIEIVLRDFRLRIVTPIVIASVISASVTQAYSERYDAIFQIPTLASSEEMFTILELPNYILLGLVCGIVAAAFTWLLYWTEDRFDTIKIHPIAKPVVGAAVLGLLGVAAVYIARHQPESTMTYPPFFSNGYPFIETLLDPAFYADRPFLFLFGGLVFVGLLKAIGTAATLGSGGSGGIFAPSLFMGACAGGALGTFVDSIDFLPNGPPAAYALVGMAAVVAGTTHAPLTAILILFEITRDYRVILPIMFAAVIATVVSQLIDRDSIYTRKLRRRGLRIGTSVDLTLLRRHTAEEVPWSQPHAVRPGDPVRRLLNLASETYAHDFVVLSDEERYLGMVTGENIQVALLEPEAIPLLIASELMRTDLPTVTPGESLDAVLDKFANADVESLAVLKSSEGGEVIGVLTRRQVMDYYHRAIGEHA
ncbi:MAG: chloride channel protein [Phycisphaerales bacterium]|nr:chloride channel protein [Phycisphaerales bacterium]